MIIELAHNVAQFSHCAAQGKIGSGFDVSSAIYGSQIYTRFSPSIIANLLQQVCSFLNVLQRASLTSFLVLYSLTQVYPTHKLCCLAYSLVQGISFVVTFIERRTNAMLVIGITNIKILNCHQGYHSF